MWTSVLSPPTGGMMSIFLMGCYDPKSEKWCTVTKCAGGHDDATLARLQTELDMVKISKVRWSLAWRWSKECSARDLVKPSSCRAAIEVLIKCRTEVLCQDWMVSQLQLNWVNRSKNLHENWDVGTAISWRWCTAWDLYSDTEWEARHHLVPAQSFIGKSSTSTIFLAYCNRWRQSLDGAASERCLSGCSCS